MERFLTPLFRIGGGGKIGEAAGRAVGGGSAARWILVFGRRMAEFLCDGRTV